jgi:hypothetical protein
MESHNETRVQPIYANKMFFKNDKLSLSLTSSLALRDPLPRPIQDNAFLNYSC